MKANGTDYLLTVEPSNLTEEQHVAIKKLLSEVEKKKQKKKKKVKKSAVGTVVALSPDMYATHTSLSRVERANKACDRSEDEVPLLNAAILVDGTGSISMNDAMTREPYVPKDAAPACIALSPALLAMLDDNLLFKSLQAEAASAPSIQV